MMAYIQLFESLNRKKIQICPNTKLYYSGKEVIQPVHVHACKCRILCGEWKVLRALPELTL